MPMRRATGMSAGLFNPYAKSGREGIFWEVEANTAGAEELSFNALDEHTYGLYDSASLCGG